MSGNPGVSGGDAEVFLEDANASVLGTLLSTKFQCCFFFKSPGDQTIGSFSPVFSSRKSE